MSICRPRTSRLYRSHLPFSRALRRISLQPPVLDPKTASLLVVDSHCSNVVARASCSPRRRPSRFLLCGATTGFRSDRVSAIQFAAPTLAPRLSHLFPATAATTYPRTSRNVHVTGNKAPAAHVRWRSTSYLVPAMPWLKAEHWADVARQHKWRTCYIMDRSLRGER
ncbi:hypothetical protein FA95DRAFT_617830 [Auriscalpium vulgare]|uniref:Uncharacterized protein n=1 Tax=Auriscalpium vulgare TaxID=40419 RepID=A0ACB8RD06_9AGAM|nr:hypothetical protein FA95DRAFT_617830 [Auriscalpium vulgare]